MNQFPSTFSALIAALTLTASAADHFLRPQVNPSGLPVTTENLVITYESADAAKTAPAPALKMLPPGKKLAISARWDDRHPNNITMHALMTKYGWKGTFYLNDPKAEQKQEWAQDHEKKLLAGGCSVGVHGSLHRKLPELSPDEMFREIAFNRARLEANCDRPINTQAYAYGLFADKNKPEAALQISEIFFRSGLLHCVYAWSIRPEYGLRPTDRATGLQFTPGDKDTKRENFIKGMEESLKKEWFLKTIPCIFMGVHARQQNADWAELEAGIAKYANRPEWWYCNQNEFAARFYEFNQASLLRRGQDGAKVTYQARRFPAAALGDRQTLTIAAPFARLANYRGETLKVLNPGTPEAEFELPPVEVAAFPTLVEQVTLSKNDTSPVKLSKFPGMAVFLSYDRQSNKAILTLDPGKTLLEVASATARLPLAWPAPGVLRKDKQVTVAMKTDFVFDLPPVVSDPGERPTLWLEIDFRRGDAAGRLHILLDK
ncbi:MAG: polysaccharide deacetylase family protein [Victivallaceae bacterium]